MREKNIASLLQLFHCFNNELIVSLGLVLCPALLTIKQKLNRLFYIVIKNENVSRANSCLKLTGNIFFSWILFISDQDVNL